MPFFYFRVSSGEFQLRGRIVSVIVNPVMKITRRHFLQTSSIAALGTAALPALAVRKDKSESLVKKLYDSLDEKQRKAVAFPWDYKNHNGLLRKHISNNWSDDYFR